MTPVQLRVSRGAARYGTGPGRVTGEQTLAAAVLFALGLRQFVTAGVTTGYILALLFLPVWIVHLREFRGARILMGMGCFTAVWGIILASNSISSGHIVSSSNRKALTILLLGTLCGVGVVLWARRIMPDWAVATCFGMGMLAGGTAGFSAGDGNAWKFIWAVPVGVTLLALTARSTRLLPQISALIFLALISIVLDSRSYFATFAFSGLLVVWQMRSRLVHGRLRWGGTALLLGALGVGMYYLASTLLVDGYLGQNVQARSVEQIRTSGSLILGGRPELAASFALMKHNIAGFGVGVVPTPQDVLVAKSGMSSIHYAPNNGYVERFMFGGHIELHSMFGDLWAGWGLAGLAFLAIIGFWVVRGLAANLANRSAAPALLFLSIWTLWNTLFSPLYASAPTLLITLGLAAVPSASRFGIASNRARRANGVPD